ncbi:MAG: ATP-dependent DNA helicase RecG [Candidatus Calescibacterium sp.]|nr:ATP-dependent DNA helicase RecG [Candidatus Calescibacterium sp.]MDW8087414.1 ATP-dependent DNA helicase RecG [Candidatus Calescibacterium sp.]
MSDEKKLQAEEFLTKAQNILSTDVRFIKGIGPNVAQHLYKKGIFKVEDLIFSIPKAYENRGNIKKISELQEGEKAAVIGRIKFSSEVITPNGRKMWKIILSDDSGNLECVWFSWTEYIDLFKEGNEVCVFGTVKFFRKTPQMYHPKIVKSQDISKLKLGKIVPVYTISDPVDSSMTARAIRKVIEQVGDYIFSFVPKSIEEKNQIMPLKEAILKVHIPEKYAQSLDEIEQAKKRIIFEEIFRTQLALLLKRKYVIDKKAQQFFVSDSLLSFFFSTLPFKLTSAQLRVIEEIRKDLEKPNPMYRLLQGDVGSGKTLVAFVACLICSAAGYQSVVMAPTEILANQLYQNFVNFGKPLGLKIGIITGSTRTSERKELYEALQKGYINSLVGTHALIYDDNINFKNLGLVVIDEQHRFGVLQRISLINKGKEYSPHILVMTATPIPRTVALTVWGDLDISVIDEMPPERKGVRTKVYYENEMHIVWNEIQRELIEGGKIFIVYPLLKESEKIDLPSAEKMYKVISEKFSSWGVGLIHGKMPGDKKAEVIKDFAEGKIRILVSTTVIEVGIDVPDATMIVIEHAERFGLSQIHQLRGRVGRKDKEGKCILVIPDKISENSEKRIRILEKENNGFKISEEDLNIRGPGEILGIKQHGANELKVEYIKDLKLISFAREIAKSIANQDVIEHNDEKILFEKIVDKFLSDKIPFTMSG